ncbi:MAG: Gfo/Idh/MocA family oxidoreductase [Candidatus Omnitrophica bacterium]|nr:Gfo/Idh/MocA family oxidoreductase [Candidatus Omnitrophota bacterium]
MKSINVVVVGGGMYVCGRGVEGYGTIMPALLEAKRHDQVGQVVIVTTKSSSARAASKKTIALGRLMGVNADIKYYPQNGCDVKAYKKVLRNIRTPAACIIAVPDSLHADIAEYSIEHGFHTLVVKPLATTVKEVKRLIKAQNEHGVYCAVEFHKRFDDANIKMKDVIASGALGDLLYFIIEFSQRKVMPLKVFRAWASTTNIFNYLGVHYVDIIYYTTCAKPMRVMAIGQKNWLLRRGLDTYDAIEAVIEWHGSSGNKFSSHIITNWIDPDSTSAMSDQRIKVIGAQGRFESDQKDRGITMISDKRGIETFNPYFCAAYGRPGEVEYRGYGIKSIQTFLQDVSDIEKGAVTIKELEAKRPTFRTSLISTAVIEGVDRSLKKGSEWVEVKGI